MAEKKIKSFLLRVDAETLEQVQRWADQEFRSLNGQLEWLLRDALRRHGRANSQQRRHD